MDGTAEHAVRPDKEPTHIARHRCNESRRRDIPPRGYPGMRVVPIDPDGLDCWLGGAECDTSKTEHVGLGS